jgi:hypothetical protein
MPTLRVGPERHAGRQRRSGRAVAPFEFEGGVTDVVEALTGLPAESFETTARRYAALPFARPTLGNRLSSRARWRSPWRQGKRGSNTSLRCDGANRKALGEKRSKTRAGARRMPNRWRSMVDRR